MSRRTRKMLPFLAVAVLLSAACGGGNGAGSAAPGTTLSPSASPNLSFEEQLSQFVRPALLTVSDLPAGWTQVFFPESAHVQVPDRMCAPFDGPFPAYSWRVGFHGEAAAGNAAQTIAAFAADDASVYLARLRQSLASCGAGREPFPASSLGDETVGYRRASPSGDVEIFVAVRRGRTVLFLNCFAHSPVDLSFVEGLARKMDEKFMAVVTSASPFPPAN